MAEDKKTVTMDPKLLPKQILMVTDIFAKEEYEMELESQT